MATSGVAYANARSASGASYQKIAGAAEPNRVRHRAGEGYIPKVYRQPRTHRYAHVGSIEYAVRVARARSHRIRTVNDMRQICRHGTPEESGDGSIQIAWYFTRYGGRVARSRVRGVLSCMFYRRAVDHARR